MTEKNSLTIRSLLVNREVGLVFGALVSFVIVLQLISLLELNPFANIIVRLLLVPGYLVMLGYVVVLVNFGPEVGRIGWILGLGIYLYIISVVIGGGYRWYRDNKHRS